MKYTKEQRHELYKYALNAFNNDEAFFLCSCLILAEHKILNIRFCFDINNYPELLKFKPPFKNKGDAWWHIDNLELRINALETCIKQTEP